MLSVKRHIPILLAAVLSAGCGKDAVSPDPSVPTAPEEPVVSQIPIRWSVAAEDETRSLVGSTNSAENGWVAFETACTPTGKSYTDKNGSEAAGKGRAIGIWSDYTYTTASGQETTVNNLFKDTRLIYDAEAGDNPHNHWNYEGTSLYWFIGGRYSFRAFFPQRLQDQITSSSTASTFVIEYITQTTQEDLMVAYAEFDTAKDDMNKPVDLRFRHAMAAVRFRFRLAYEGEDRLTSLYWENTSQSFKTQSVMLYGLGAGREEEVQWSEGHGVPATEQLYLWRHAEGVPMTSTLRSDDTLETSDAWAYSGTADEVTAGAQYLDNDGWLLIVPQPSPGDVQLCFTTEDGGSTVSKVTIPSVTEVDANGNTLSTEYEAGKRYTYTVTISGTYLTLSLSASDWNKRDSSYEIVF